MNQNCIGTNWGLLAAIYLGLLLFGVGFNALIAWTERKGYLQGYTSLFVALGVSVTILAMTLIDPSFALATLGAFVASGAPMIAGSIWRHMMERERQLDYLRKEAVHGDADKEMASRS